MLYIHAFILALVALAVSGGASAQQGPFVPLPGDYFETAGRVKVQQPINHLTLPGGKRLFENSNLDTDGGLVRATGTGTIRNPSGNDLPVQTQSRIPNANVAGALGRATVKIVASVGVLGTGVALWELYKELGFDLTKDAAGVPVVRKIDSSVCTVSPCYVYSLQIFTGHSGSGSTPLAACQNVIANVVHPSQTFTNARMKFPSSREWGDCQWDQYWKSDGSYITSNESTIDRSSEVAPSSANYLPSSQQEFLDAVAAKSGWPSTSAISRAIADSVAATGEKIGTGTPTVTGPATSPGTTTTTTDTVNDTTTVTTITHNHTYAGDTITTTTINNTTTTNNTTGAVTTNTTTTAPSAAPPPPAEVCGLPGKPACAIDETGMPTQADIDSKMSKTKQQDIFKDLDAMVADPTGKLPAMPALNWSFALPTGCAVLEIPAFAPFITGVDVCQFQPMFHSVMSVVWMLGGLFGAISLFMKNALSH